MSILSAILLTIVGLIGAGCIIVTLVAAIVIVDRVRVLPDVIDRLDSIEEYLDDLSADVNASLGIPTYEFGDGTPMPTDVQDIMNKMGTGTPVSQEEIEKLEAFFNEANGTFSDEDDDDDDDEEKKPWKK